jgi:hypothetical protein
MLNDIIGGFMKLKSKKIMIIGAILMILLVVLGIFGNQYLTEKANKEEAITLAKNFNLNKTNNNKYDLDFSSLFGSAYAEDIMMNDSKTYKQLGWNCEKVNEDIYYTTLSYRYANSDEINVIAFQVNLNLNKTSFINDNPNLIDYYKKHNFIKDNHVLKTYKKLFK